MGDPIERLKKHLIHIEAWGEQDHDELVAEVDNSVRLASEEAESFGTLHSEAVSSPSTMFDDVYATMPPNLVRQREQAGF
jgi:2-oxoisovalerate dehydrogenase E1 component alpha subunit